MPANTTTELVQLDIARQNAKKDESIISTAYSWYRWGKVAKNLGEMALSATPSGAIKFGAQLLLQPIADKISEQTGYESISTTVRIGIACTDPVGSAISYGAQWATDAALAHYEISNPHLKAVLKITSQEASSKLTTTVKSTETYQAASDCVVQKFEETTVGVNVKSLQQKVDNQCKKFDTHEKVKVAVKIGNDTAKALSEKTEELPGVAKINQAKEQIKEIKATISDKLENQVTNKITEKFREYDNSGATMIRNSRLKEIEAGRQFLETRLEKIRAKKQVNENKLKKWQELKLAAEKANDETALAKATGKLEKYEKLSARASRKESSCNTRLEAMEKNISRNTEQLKQLRFKELNNKLEALTAKQKLLQNNLKTANSDEAKKLLQEKLTILEKEIAETASLCELIIAESAKNDSDNTMEDKAMQVMPALSSNSR